jgi:putative transposase
MKLKHYDHDGRARFITFCTHRKLPLLTNNRFRRILIQVINDVRKEEGFQLLGYVIMPEHVHLIIVPRIEDEAGAIVGEIKIRSAKTILQLMKSGEQSMLNQLLAKRDGVKKFVFWQRRCYDHNCRTDDAVWKTIEYCHNNPVKRGLVSSPGRWQWSSYNWYRGVSESVLEMDVSE